MSSSDHKHVFSSKVINSETKATYLKGKSTKFTKFFRGLDSQGISAYAIRTRACSHPECNAVRHYLDIRLPQVKKILVRQQEGDEQHAQMSKVLASQEQRVRKLCKMVRSLNRAGGDTQTSNGLAWSKKLRIRRAHRCSGKKCYSA